MEIRLYLLRDGLYSLFLRYVFWCERVYGWRRILLFKKGGKGIREYLYDVWIVEEVKIYCIKFFGKIVKIIKENRCYLGYIVWFMNNEIKLMILVNVELNFFLK